MEQRDMVDQKTIYSAVHQHIVHAEGVSWNRFQNFLTTNSITLLVWAAIFMAEPTLRFRLLLLLLICLLGVVNSVFWAYLGRRGRQFLSFYVSLGAKMESDGACFPEHLAEYKLCDLIEEKRDGDKKDRKVRYRFAGSWFVLFWAPWLLAAVYVLLGVLSVMSVSTAG